MNFGRTSWGRAEQKEKCTLLYLNSNNAMRTLPFDACRDCEEKSFDLTTVNSDFEKEVVCMLH